MGGYLMARKIGPLPMVSMLPRKIQLAITGENLIHLNHNMSDSSAGAAGLICRTPRSGEILKPIHYKAHEINPIDMKGPSNRRISQIDGYRLLNNGRPFDFFEQQESAAYFLLITSDFLHPFRAFLFIVMSFLFVERLSRGSRNIYRTRCALYTLTFINVCVDITYLVKLDGRDYFLQRANTEELRCL